MITYNVMTNPVIPVTMIDHTKRVVGIREALLNAPHVKSINAQPREEYALLRFLVAFLMDMLHPETVYDRRSLYNSGSFSEKALDEYIALCEKDYPCFDLFDTDHPFMQAAYNRGLDEKSTKPVSVLQIDLPSGNNHIFLDHRKSDAHVMTPAEAFAEMLSLYTFCTAGAQDYPSCVNNVPPVYSVVEGNNLFETLVLNMIGSRECGQLDYGQGTVPWRKNNIIIPKNLVADITLLEGLTWQPRRITLLCDEDGMIRKVCLQQGLNFKGNNLWKDPHVAYVFSKKENAWGKIKPDIGRSLWRDVGTLLADNASEKFRPPLNVIQAPEVLDNDTLILSIRQVGVVTSNASYVNLNYDSLSIPDCFMTDYALAELLRYDLGIIERMQGRIAREVNKRINHSAKKKNVASLAEQARQHFLDQAHNLVFNKYIPNLLEIKTEINEEKIQNHKQIVHETIKYAIINTVRDVINRTGSTSDNLLLQVEIKSTIMMEFAKIIKEGKADND